MFFKSLVLLCSLSGQALAVGCSHNNLLNAFIKSSSQAAAFCSTYTQGPGSPLPTFVPTTYEASKYSSACSCIETSTTVPTSTTSTSSVASATSCSNVCPVCDPYVITITATASTSYMLSTTITIYQTSTTSQEVDFTTTVPASTITLTVTQTTSTPFEVDFTSTQPASTVTSTITVTQTTSTPFEVDFTTTQPPSTVTITASCSSSSTSTTSSAGNTCASPLPDTCPGPICTDLLTDTSNCGQCGLTCSLANAIPSCVDGQCKVASCNINFGDCNLAPSDGCETNLLFDSFNCNTCHNVCNFPHANALCSGGTCHLNGCQSGFQNCNGYEPDGCEVNVNSDVNNCGACFHQCSFNNGSPSCNGGGCGITCFSGFKNCNGNPNDGCEVNILNDSQNCGACNHQCSGLTPFCSNGNCVV